MSAVDEVIGNIVPISVLLQIKFSPEVCKFLRNECDDECMKKMCFHLFANELREYVETNTPPQVFHRKAFFKHLLSDLRATYPNCELSQNLIGFVSVIVQKDSLNESCITLLNFSSRKN
jgi:hypothetical protein